MIKWYLNRCETKSIDWCSLWTHWNKYIANIWIGVVNQALESELGHIPHACYGEDTRGLSNNPFNMDDEDKIIKIDTQALLKACS
jgi:hypothetical protein